MVLEKSTDGSVVFWRSFSPCQAPRRWFLVLSQVSTLLAVGREQIAVDGGGDENALAVSSGIRKMVCLAFVPPDLSSSRYSPARGMTPKMSSPESLADFVHAASGAVYEIFTVHLLTVFFALTVKYSPRIISHTSKLRLKVTPLSMALPTAAMASS